MGWGKEWGHGMWTGAADLREGHCEAEPEGSVGEPCRGAAAAVPAMGGQSPCNQMSCEDHKWHVRGV